MRRYSMIVAVLFVFTSCASSGTDAQPLSGSETDPEGAIAEEIQAEEPGHDEPGQAQQQEREGFVDDGPEHHLIYPAESIEFEDGPASLEEGARFTVLEGDPGEEEFFTMRLELPDGFRINPHTHPGVERLTVISGTFRLGHGDEFDSDAATPLEAGSYFSMPVGHSHFAEADGETVVQLSSIGPWEIDYIDPAHDPRIRVQN